VFVDGTYRGEMKANAAFDADGYQYIVDNLDPGQNYDVAVKVCKTVDVFEMKSAVI